MSIADKDTLLGQAVVLLGAAASGLDEIVQAAAVDQAVSELGWAFPILDGPQSYWAVERTKRHLLQILVTQAAMKFQYKQIHLEQRFKHLSQLIKTADEAFLLFAEENVELFPAASTGFSDFAYYIENGFVYSPTGEEGYRFPTCLV